jgi:hypothetical protein
MSKYENRRYNKNETSKEFYVRRKKEIDDLVESEAWKNHMDKAWAEYKAVNNK